MAERLLVRATDGIVFPRAAPFSGYVGYERALGAPPSPDDHVVPSGPRYRLRQEPEQVPNTSYYRRAIARGDIKRTEIETSQPEGGESVSNKAKRDPVAPRPETDCDSEPFAESQP